MTDQKGIIGETDSDGFPIIWKFVAELPSSAFRNELPYLVVISWRYDNEDNNGMPIGSTQERMRQLEHALIKEIQPKIKGYHAYDRTGKFLREFVFYVKDTKEFEQHLNDTLVGHIRYPLEIDYYEDPDWNEFRSLLKDFNFL